MNEKLLSDCQREDLGEHHHALVFGRARIWHNDLTDNHEFRWHWSGTAWWKALWYPHRGEPSSSGAWGVYGANGGSFTGPGDAELTHWLPMPPIPGEPKP